MEWGTIFWTIELQKIKILSVGRYMWRKALGYSSRECVISAAILRAIWQYQSKLELHILFDYSSVGNLT